MPSCGKRRSIDNSTKFFSSLCTIVGSRSACSTVTLPQYSFTVQILGRALAELRDTGGRYYWFWHLRGNILMSQLAAPMPPGLSWSSPTCMCTPEIAWDFWAPPIFVGGREVKVPNYNYSDDVTICSADDIPAYSTDTIAIAYEKWRQKHRKLQLLL